jgi:hypothetical protein
MRAMLCGLLSIGLLIALAGVSVAASKREKPRRSSGYYYNSPSELTERQLRNQRAYEGRILRASLERFTLWQPSLVGTETARKRR